MKITPLLGSLITAATLAMAMPAAAQVRINILIAPPAPIYESAPMMAPGYVWAPGYWAWLNDRHVWIRGRTIIQRVGYRWEPDHWEQRSNGYYRQPGNWVRATQYEPQRMEMGKKPKHWKDDDHRWEKQRGKNGRGKKHGDD